MTQNQSITPPAAPDRTWWPLALARYTHNRRENLGLTIAQAAEMAGIEISQWCALEDGWVPADRNTIRAIAATLGIRWMELETVARLVRMLQQPC